MTKDVGTLAEIGAKSRDTVEWLGEDGKEEETAILTIGVIAGGRYYCSDNPDEWLSEEDQWRIVSRASDTTGHVQDVATTVTKQVIVEGIHGNLYIHEASCSSITIKLVDFMTPESDIDGYHTIEATKDQIALLVAQLTDIRDAMEEQE